MANNLMSNNNTKEIHTPQITVEKNILSFPDYFLQITNISQVSVAPIPKKKTGGIYFAAVLLCISGLVSAIGFISTGINQTSRRYSSFGSYSRASSPSPDVVIFAILGVILVIVGIVIIYKTYTSNRDLGHILSIQMNSGSSFLFHAYEIEFLNRVIECLKDCANNENASAIINFDNCQIIRNLENSKVVVGSGNTL